MALPQPQSPAPLRKGLEKSEKAERKNHSKKGENLRILISVTVVGSVGPIRVVVREDELVSSIISTVLKNYAREGRRPILGSELDNFVLYHAGDGSCALAPMEPIGTFRSRNFLLCKKQSVTSEDKSATPGRENGKKRAAGWKAWFSRYLLL
ncbi:hypothetical protein HPP92_023039 [Vanilla planifolia]|uniref:DUF7054 domain-containing protein n=1 Tax=Vanilla planifolia TaxID=51239 RepID=A0A835UHT3_VANPL|nr:hypothetical protein HPP92_023350 [Vanilla planifolia]KAG0459911.1 hypothetical protein HPP92_023039 [Vanilla planifolia]